MKRNKKINLLFAAQSGYIGGAEVELLSTIKNIDKDIFNAWVVFPNKGKVINLFKRHKINTRIVSLKNWHLARERLLALMKINSIDLACTITPRIFETAITARLSGIPHLWYLHARLDSAYPKLNLRRNREIMGLIYSLSQRVIVCSRYIKMQFEEFGLGDKVTVINNGIDLNDFQETGICENRFRSELGIRKKDFLVGMVGRLDPQKRHRDFIKAAALIRKRSVNSKIKFIIVGGESTREYISRLIALNRKNNNPVCFLGFRNNISEIMQALDLLVMPSVGEALGMAILEAMACGKPVLAVSSGGIPDIVLDGKTGILVPPGNPSAIAESIMGLAADPEKHAALGRAGRKRVEKLYDIKNTIRDLETVWYKVLKTKCI